MTDVSGTADTHTVMSVIEEDIESISFLISNNGFTTRELERINQLVLSLYRTLIVRIDFNE